MEGEGSEEERLTYSQANPCAKKFTEDDIGLRIDSHKRRSTAHQYLHRSESKMMLDQEYENDYYVEQPDYAEPSAEQTGEFESPGSNESSMNCQSLGLSLHGSVNQNV